MSKYVERTHRMREQRWLIYEMIHVMRVESVLMLLRRFLFAVGLDLYTDYINFRSKVKKYDDILKEML